MKNALFATAALTLSAISAAPAAAQVNGIAVADPAVSVAGSQALQSAFQQISTTFAQARTTLDQQQQQRQGLIRQFDTNGDGQLSQEEQTAAQANATAIQQIQALDEQIAQTQAPITQARVYTVEQIAQQLSPAVQQVVQANGIQMILSPNAALYIADGVDVTPKIIAALNGLVPSVSTSVPQGWQPSQQTVSLYQQVQEILVSVAVQQAQAQQQQPATPVQGR